MESYVLVHVADMADDDEVRELRPIAARVLKASSPTVAVSEYVKSVDAGELSSNDRIILISSNIDNAGSPWSGTHPPTSLTVELFKLIPPKPYWSAKRVEL